VIRGLAIAALLAGCGSFEDPTIVLDLRVLAMSAEMTSAVPGPGPEQVVDVDLTMPMATELLEQLRPTRVCALVADPRHERDLRWSMTACACAVWRRCA